MKGAINWASQMDPTGEESTIIQSNWVESLAMNFFKAVVVSSSTGFSGQ